jgi:hypothetical protein
MLDLYTEGEDRTYPRAQSGVTVPQKANSEERPASEGGSYTSKSNPRETQEKASGLKA